MPIQKVIIPENNRKLKHKFGKEPAIAKKEIPKLNNIDKRKTCQQEHGQEVWNEHARTKFTAQEIYPQYNTKKLILKIT